MYSTGALKHTSVDRNEKIVGSRRKVDKNVIFVITYFFFTIFFFGTTFYNLMYYCKSILGE